VGDHVEGRVQRSESTADQVHQVEDTGIGMSEEFQAKDLFRPFRQENNLTPGTGLVSVAPYARTSIEN